MRFPWFPVGLPVVSSARSALLGLALLLGLTSATAVQAGIQTKEISYEHEGEPLKGFLAWDDSLTGNRPGILVVHEWWGLNDYARTRAKQLAELGYVAFALDMFGEGKVTEHATQAMEWSGTVRSNTQKWRDRALSGLNVLKKQPGVDQDNLAAIGYCFGGSTVLHLAYADAPVKGVVSFHGALPPPPVDASLKTKVLVCQGGADSFVPAATVDAFAFGMEQAKAHYTIVVFGGAKHGFSNPDAARYGIDGIAYDPSAEKHSWAIMQMFFDDIFDKPAPKAVKQ
ncbi:dienelactone hydrolase family protein [Planctomicrobium piriforme]|uniref:Dienelactone hydrolase n=1 Tax=Planctomicrobium piriforme TaxID=1576369 RepID=A0A1I3FF58_9PLAN|nr:dienelactone hydrolase family protein [Planctomicrobium piriforme]SFI09858.1 Dienelactone hydrolase [Planctomicrobium piriforme]